MPRRTSITYSLLALLMAALLWWILRDDANGPSDATPALEPETRGKDQAPELRVHGTRPSAPTSPEGLPPAGAGGASADQEDPILPNQTRIHGTVRLRESRTPVEGGRVKLALLQPADWPGSWEAVRAMKEDERIRVNFDAQAEVKKDGSYRMDVERGVRVIGARIQPRIYFWQGKALGNYVDTTVDVQVLAEGERVELDLLVDPGIQLAGRVVDARTGRPVAGARVLRAVLFGPYAGAISEADGTFVISGLRPRDVEHERPLEFRVTHPDYVPHLAVTRHDAATGKYAELDVRLVSGVRVAGVVRMDGKPPRNEVRLYLLEVGGGESPFGVAERVLAETDTEDGGRFAFPPVEPTAHAALFVPSAGHWSSAGGTGYEKPGLDLRKDRTDLVVELESTVRTPVRPHFPDGTLATWKESRTLVEDPMGSWRTSFHRGSKDDPVWRAALQPGHGHHVVVFAERKEKDGKKRRYRGEAAVRIADREAAQRGIWVDLVPYDPPPIPSARARMQHATINAVDYAQYVWQLQVRDAATRESLGGRQIGFFSRSGTAVSTGIPEDGRLRLVVGLGVTRLRIHVEGYEPLEVRVEPREPGYAEAVLDLQPLDDR